jgi:hypothetical protein
MPTSTRPLSFALLALLAAPLGCTTEVGNDPASVTAVAMLATQSPPAKGDVALGQLDPDTLLVFIGGSSPSCADPFLPAWHQGSGCAGPDRNTWEIILAIPPAQQKAGTLSFGTIHDGSGQPDPSIVSDQELQIVQGDQCAGGSAPLSGTMSVVSIDASSIAMTFDGASMPQGSSGIGAMADVHQLLGGKTTKATRCP